MGCCNSKASIDPEKEEEGKDNNGERSIPLKEVEGKQQRSESKRMKSSQSRKIEKAARKEIARERGRRSRLDDGHGRDGVCFCAFP